MPAVRIRTSTGWQDMAMQGSQGVFGGSSRYVRAIRSTALALTTGTFTTVPFTAARFDSGGQWLAGDATHLVCLEAGTYVIGALVNFASNVSSFRYCQIIVEQAVGGTRVATAQRNIGDAAENQLNCVEQLVVGDKLRLEVYQATGSTINIQAGNTPNAAEMWMASTTGPQGAPGGTGGSLSLLRNEQFADLSFWTSIKSGALTDVTLTGAGRMYDNASSGNPVMVTRSGSTVKRARFVCRLDLEGAFGAGGFQMVLWLSSTRWMMVQFQSNGAVIWDVVSGTPTTQIASDATKTWSAGSVGFPKPYWLEFSYDSGFATAAVYDHNPLLSDRPPTWSIGGELTNAQKSVFIGQSFEYGWNMNNMAVNTYIADFLVYEISSVVGTLGAPFLPGNITGAYNLLLAGAPMSSLLATLTADNVVTVTGLNPGAFAFLTFLQDSVGGRKLSISYGGVTTPWAINLNPNQPTQYLMTGLASDYMMTELGS